MSMPVTAARARLVLPVAIATLLSACALWPVTPEPVAGSEAGCVVLLHGLVRTSASLQRLAGYLQAAGYTVENWSYPSRRQPIEVLAADAVPAVHSLIMRDPEVMQQVVNFLHRGRFAREPGAPHGGPP